MSVEYKNYLFDLDESCSTAENAELKSFDKMFSAWEVSYNIWKNQNEFNPDKKYVEDYRR